ncbi:MAG TPA: ATP-binding protein [Flavitalea sp.]|nr:ATP-binding protein [Flavitalea sp.]
MNIFQTTSLQKSFPFLKKLMFWRMFPFHLLNKSSYWQQNTSGWKKRYNSLLDLGVYENMPVYEMQRVRFSNFIGLFCQTFYLSYVLLGVLIHSPFLSLMTLSMLVTGLLGFWFNKRRHYNLARSMFITSFSVLLFFICNTLNIGGHFIFFYFPAFIAYTLYYDLEKDLPNALINLSVSISCAVCSFVLPHQLFMAENVSENWWEFVRNLNYFMAFGVTITFVFFAVFHVNKSGRQLVEVWQEAERQKLELSEAKQKADIAVIAKSRFLSNMSHEMRTPLNGIVGTVNLMLQEPSLPGQQQNFEVLKYSSEHMLSVVNDVLDFSKIEAGKMELSDDAFNMKTLLDKIFTVFRNQFAEKKVDFEFQIDKELNKDFKGDETRLRQVLTNLIGNALKFTEKGKVKCMAHIAMADSLSANVFFSVEDTGIGMSDEQQQMIFEAFNQGETSTTRRFGGTGLGLTISKKIVSMLGGQLHVESEPGKGSRFFFTIRMPFSQFNTGVVNEKKVSTLPSLKGTKVLVAEDSPLNMTITRKFLERWDVEIHEATNGKEAVDLFVKNEYDLLLIDLDMPVMDGYQALEEIRKTDATIPAIAFTAAVFPNMLEQLKAKGFSDFMQKPFRPEDLHKKIALYCEHQRRNTA